MDGLVAGDRYVFFSVDEEIVVHDVDAWATASRSRVGRELALELSTWNDMPSDEKSAQRRAAIARRLDGRSRVTAAIVEKSGDAAAQHDRLMMHAADFVRHTADGLELPGWHRLAFAKHALFRQTYMTWGIADPRSSWPDLRINAVDLEAAAANASALREAAHPRAVHVIDDLAVGHRLRADLEELARSTGLVRMHIADDGSTLRLGPTLIGSVLGEWDAGAPSLDLVAARPVSIGPLASSLIARELLYVNARTAGALSQELSITLGRTFELSWSDLSARETRVERN